MLSRPRLVLTAGLLALATAVLVGADGPRRRSSAMARPNAGVAKAALDRLYRPTLVLRNGSSRGTGTVVASEPDETLILTAAHVVAGAGALQVELRPYNLGIEGDERQLAGDWPRLVAAERVAVDAAADVALVRVRGMVRLPYVARLVAGGSEPRPGDVLTSIGIDHATELIGWKTDVQGMALLDLAALSRRGDKGEGRPFIVTTKPSVSGRSGGGLFRSDGTIAGVCVGHMQVEGRGVVGVFASAESIRRLVRESGQEQRLARPSAPGRAPRKGS